MNNKEALRALAAQLRHPQGEMGVELGAFMHETNIGMTMHAIACLEIADKDSVLELGHGNGGHLAMLLAFARDIHYHGLEISLLMHEQAKALNHALLQPDRISFSMYDGFHIPFPDHSFDRAFTVNTIYFWENPSGLLSELYRVLRPGALLCITFAHEDFMKQLPFTQFGFVLYSVGRVKAMVQETCFQIRSVNTQEEMIKSKTGEQVNRTFSSIVVEKN